MKLNTKFEITFSLQQINLYPSRADTGKKKQGIISQLNHLKEEEEMLEDKLQSRKKQFHVLVQSIHRLQELIDQEEEATDAMIASVHSVNMSKYICKKFLVECLKIHIMMHCCIL